MEYNDDNNSLADDLPEIEEVLVKCEPPDYLEMVDEIVSENEDVPEYVTTDAIHDDQQNGGLTKTEHSHSSESDHKSDICLKQFSENVNLKAFHTKNELPLKDDFCTEIFNNKSISDETHSCTNSTECAICQRQSSDIKSILLQKYTYTGDKSYTCKVCHKEFIENSLLNMHMREHVDETSDNKTKTCRICFKTFKQKSSLQLHMGLHTPEEPFECHFCDKQFSGVRALKTHQRLHLEEKHECNSCHKVFAISGQLKQHSWIHATEKPFLCSICFKQFAQKMALANHQMVHTGGKLHICDICQKEFTHLGSFKYHMRNHSTPKNMVEKLQIIHTAEKETL